MQETYNQTELQRKMFDVEHLIYNQGCSQYKSDKSCQREVELLIRGVHNTNQIRG